MAQTGLAPIKAALVARLRTNAGLVAGLSGGMHEGVALTGKLPPYLTYRVGYAVRRTTKDSVVTKVGFDIVITGYDQVEAGFLDELVMDTLNDVALDVAGQRTMLCRRVADLSDGDVDEAGHKIYLVGGTFEVWTDQAR